MVFQYMLTKGSIWFSEPSVTQMLVVPVANRTGAFAHVTLVTLLVLAKLTCNLVNDVLSIAFASETILTGMTCFPAGRAWGTDKG